MKAYTCNSVKRHTKSFEERHISRSHLVSSKNQFFWGGFCEIILESYCSAVKKIDGNCS